MFRFVVFMLIFLPGFQVLARDNVKTTERDREILETVLHKLAPEKEKSTAELLVLAGMQFLGTPYVASTLEGEKEELVVNLRGMDCTTFAEYCLAIALTAKSASPCFDTFAAQLQKIRYRDGKIDGYASRLHYFSDWIFDNAAKKLVQTDDGEMGGEVFPLAVNFMSTHPQSYPQLNDHSELVPEMEKTETAINTRKMYFFPQEKIGKLEHLLQDGDIVGITTSISGLDMSHVGILVRKNGRIHLLHASSAAQKVVLSGNTLEDYLKAGKRTTGIMLARPL